MAAPLKDSFGPAVAVGLADLLTRVDPGFAEQDFVSDATADFADLELADRSRAVAAALARYLPADPATAIPLLTRSLPTAGQVQRWQGLDSFMLWPYTMYIAEHGLDAFEESMAAQYAITQLFTAEFSIRAFIDQRHDPTMTRLGEWVTDPSEHVRRLVSEGTRPRLPWAQRLQRFINDPTPVLPLLEQLRDDPSDYVRRSVANNLNDIAKDHPELTVAVCRDWLAADSRRRPLVRHALRTLVKAGDPAALEVLGYGGDSPIAVSAVTVTPTRVVIGESVEVAIELTNPAGDPAAVLVDFEVEFARPGPPGRKVFKGVETVVPPGGSQWVRRRVTLRQLSTRRVYPGRHQVVAISNGRRWPPVVFDVAAAPA